MPDAPIVTPRPAAAMALLRPRAPSGVEVFMVRRHIRSDFAPDVYVFPGGSVHLSDAATERTPGRCGAGGEGVTALGSGFRVAAIRECFEEAGVLLAYADGAPLRIEAAEAERYLRLRDAVRRDAALLGTFAAEAGVILATDRLVHWAHWITPEAWPKRFDTHFFLAEMPAEQEAAHDELETTAGVWVAPEEALARFAEGAFPLVFATEHQLRALSGFADVAALRAHFAATPPRTVLPRVERRDGEPRILLPDEQ